jgi:hypothetical protein
MATASATATASGSEPFSTRTTIGIAHGASPGGSGWPETDVMATIVSDSPARRRTGRRANRVARLSRDTFAGVAEPLEPSKLRREIEGGGSARYHEANAAKGKLFARERV